MTVSYTVLGVVWEYATVRDIQRLVCSVEAIGVEQTPVSLELR